MKMCCQAVCAKCDRLLDCMGLDKLDLRTAYLGEKGKTLFTGWRLISGSINSKFCTSDSWQSPMESGGVHTLASI